jgi:hypothetical protein
MDEYEREIKEYQDGIPYTVIGSTCLPTEFSCFLDGKGLKAIVKKMREGEDLRITFKAETRTKFEIVDTHKKYPPRKVSKRK